MGNVLIAGAPVDWHEAERPMRNAYMQGYWRLIASILAARLDWAMNKNLRVLLLGHVLHGRDGG